MVTNLAGSSFDIKEIRGVSSYNVDEYGIALAEGHGAGFTKERFEAEISNINELPSDELKALIVSG